MGDDIGWDNTSAYNVGVMGYKKPNIDRLAKEGMMFTDAHGRARRGGPRSSPDNPQSGPVC